MNEIIKKARAAKSAGELIELAKANGKDLTKEQAEMFFKSLSQGGEMSDEELSSAVGGCGGSEISWEKSLGFSRIDCRKGDFVGGHTFAAKTYWKCAICGGHIYCNGPLTAYTNCTHLKQHKVLGCNNCFFNENGKCNYYDDNV